MVRFLLAIAVFSLTACGSPSATDGPELPAGAHPLPLQQLRIFGPTDVAPDIMASTSLAQLRSAVVAHARFGGTCDESGRPAECWGDVQDQPAQLYIAVITNPECKRPTTDLTGLGGATIYFIHWIGKSQGVCNLALTQPMWRLYSVSRAKLPPSGTLTVRLEFPSGDHAAVESSVTLS